VSCETVADDPRRWSGRRVMPVVARTAPRSLRDVAVDPWSVSAALRDRGFRW